MLARLLRALRGHSARDEVDAWVTESVRPSRADAQQQARRARHEIHEIKKRRQNFIEEHIESNRRSQHGHTG